MSCGVYPGPAARGMEAAAFFISAFRLHCICNLVASGQRLNDVLLKDNEMLNIKSSGGHPVVYYYF